MKFIFCVVFLLLSIVGVYPQECVTYDFEEDFDLLFDNSRSVCAGSEDWTIGYYSEADIEPPNNNSYVFITPSDTLSCVTSFPFTLSSEGSLEVNVVMESASLGDNIVVLVQSEFDSSMLGQGQLVSTDGNYISTGGVQAVNIIWSFTGTQEVYIVLLGSASENSIVLVDSFRFIPPDTDADSCQVYDETEVTETPEGTTENITEGTTETEPEEATTEPVFTGTTETEPAEATTVPVFTVTTETEPEEATTEPIFTGTTESEPEEATTVPVFTVTTETEPEEATTEPVFTGTTETEPEEATTVPAFTVTTETEPEEATTEPVFTGTTETEPEEVTTEPVFTGTTETESEEVTTEQVFTGTTEREPEDATTEPAFTGTTATEPEEATSEPVFTGTTETEPEEATTEPVYTGTTETGTEEETTEPTYTGTTETGTDEETTEPSFTGTTDLETEASEQPNYSGTTDLDTEESTDGEDGTTLTPPTPEEVVQLPERSFWNALTITVVTVLCLIALSLICWYFYECGRRKARDDTPPIVVYEDFENLPQTFSVPRINKVYSDSIYSNDKYLA